MTDRPVGDPNPVEPVTFADTVARLVAPPRESLGAPGTVVTPLALVLLLSAAGAAGLHGPVSRAVDAPVSGATLWILAALAPVAALARGLFMAALAWALLVLCGTPSGFRRVVSALLYGEAVLALQNVWIAGVIAARGRFDPGDPAPVGLDVFVGAAHPVLAAVARGVTPFHVAWIVFLAFVLAPPRGRPGWKSAGVAGILWAASAALIALRVVVARNGMP